MGRAWLVAFCAAGGGQAASSALGRPTRDALLVGDAASRVSHRLRIHRHINVTIRPVAHAAALETANQEAAASPHISQDDTLAQRNGSCRFEAGVDYDRGGGGRAHATGVASKEACCVLCKARPSCGVATYLAAAQQCWFKPFGATRRPSQSSAGVVSCILLAATLPLGQTPQHDSLHRGHGSSMQHHWARIPGQLPVVPRGQGYSSSAFEQAWTQDLVAKRAGGPGLCKLAWSQRADAAEWMAWVANSTHPSGRRAQQPPHSVARHLSRFRGGHSTGFIEPLTGMARHPLAFESVCRKSLRISPAERDELRSLLSFDARARKNRRHLLFDTDYILLDNQCDKPRTRGQTRNKFFDLGCTSYGSWDDDPSKPLEAGGSAPSIPLFFSWYREHCVEFDDIYAWEGKRMDPTSWWRGVPPFLRPRIRFYNHFVEEADLNSSLYGGAGATPGSSFLKMLPHAATREDFVSVKLDIDGGPELEIAYGIANRPELAELVDEFFFEYHFDFEGNKFGWGAPPPIAVDEAIKLMHHLRAVGIRSHFWV